MINTDDLRNCKGNYSSRNYIVCYNCKDFSCKCRAENETEVCVNQYGIDGNPYESAMHYDCNVCYKENCPYRKGVNTRTHQIMVIILFMVLSMLSSLLFIEIVN